MAKNKTTKNKTRKLKRYKRKNISQLIKIIARQNEKQDKLLQRIEELEEYLNFIEVNINNVNEEEDVLMSGVVFEVDDDFEQILQDQLNKTPKEKLEEINKDKDKKKKNKKPKLYTLEEILKVFKGE
jgi:predicted NBD/HSP70 family sugar kinase|tara:strand:+ start:240 stop:620 length:381 start_codon:yes stop_codon:yes gene_type:complete